MIFIEYKFFTQILYSMKIQPQSYKILIPKVLDEKSARSILKSIERAGRTCYKSEDKITSDSAPKFVKMIIGKGHESVLEHRSLTVKFVCDRGVSHEIVRHRLASFSQESTRYCNYGNEKHGNGINVINPKQHFKNPNSYAIWQAAMEAAESFYLALIALGEQAQMARSVLPNSLKTEIVVTANLREWRTIFKQRTAFAAHPQMREIMIPLFDELVKFLPEIFGDLAEKPAEKVVEVVIEAEPKKSLATRYRTKNLDDLQVGDTFILHNDCIASCNEKVIDLKADFDITYHIIRKNFYSITVQNVEDTTLSIRILRKFKNVTFNYPSVIKL
jgi:thymidylate synthase (FAD)